MIILLFGRTNSAAMLPASRQQIIIILLSYYLIILLSYYLIILLSYILLSYCFILSCLFYLNL